MSTYSIYFSPTQGTKKMTNAIAEEFAPMQEIDLCLWEENIPQSPFTKDDLCIIGVPSYGGRVPETATQRLKQLTGNSTQVVLVVAYGNRAYDDTLLELYDTLKERGFIAIGGISAIAEHSILRQFATGRPNAEDIQQLKEFAREIQTKRLDSAPKEIHPAGNHPYKAYGGSAAKPITLDHCVKCGLCGTLCPVQAIPTEHPETTNIEQCISCMRCIQVCPHHARKLDETMLNTISQKLEPLLKDPKVNELFLS